MHTKLPRLTALIAAVVPVLGVTLSQPAPAARPVAGLDFLHTSAASAQCAVPMAARHGSWTCLSLAGTSRAVVPATDPGPRSEYCNVWGCWSVYDDFFAEFYTTSIYLGWGPRAIANVHLLVEWHLTGAQSLALPVHSTVSKLTVHTTFDGALYNGAAGVAGGGSLKELCSPNTRPAAPAHRLVAYPKGCKLYDNRNYDHNQVIEASWTFSEYPGYWFFYVRSPVSHSPRKQIYRFSDADVLSGGSSAGGWRD